MLSDNLPDNGLADKTTAFPTIFILLSIPIIHYSYISVDKIWHFFRKKIHNFFTKKEALCRDFVYLAKNLQKE